MCLDVSVGFIQYKLHMYRDMMPHQNFQLREAVKIEKKKV